MSGYKKCCDNGLDIEWLLFKWNVGNIWRDKYREVIYDIEFLGDFTGKRLYKMIATSKKLKLTKTV
jgi:hypothetical protein